MLRALLLHICVKTRTTTSGALACLKALSHSDRVGPHVADGDKFGEFNLNLWGFVIAIVLDRRRVS